MTDSYWCFCVDVQDEAVKSEAGASSSGKTSMKSVLDGLGDLWDQQLYENEYDLDSFIHSLKWAQFNLHNKTQVYWLMGQQRDVHKHCSYQP